MNKADIKRILRENSPLLQKYHVKRIGLFGSFARGTSAESSDIDLLVDFSETVSLFEYAHLADSITDHLHAKVDLVDVDSIKPMLREHILNEVEWIEGL